jgi:hypothetical protein
MNDPGREKGFPTPSTSLRRLRLLGLVCDLVGLMASGSGLKSVGRMALDNVLLYGGIVILLLGIVLTLCGFVASARNRQREALVGRGFDVITEPEQQHSR